MASGYGTLRERILAMFPAVAEAAVRNTAQETDERLADAEFRLREGTLKVVICGEFKRGKSSLLNALLDLHPGLLPEGLEIVTSVVTSVRYGPELLVTVRRETESGKVEAFPISRNELARYVSEDANRANALGVSGVDIQLKNDNLAAGLVLIDTPGLAGIYDGHQLVTHAVLQEADAIVFVTDAEEPLTDFEVEFLRTEAERLQLADDETGLIVVVTKIDKNSGYAAEVERVRTRLAAALSRPAGQLPVVPVSSRAKQRYLDRHSPKQLTLSNFAELDALIWSALVRRQAKVLLSTALVELRRATASMRTQVTVTIEAIDSSSAEAISAHAAIIQARFDHFDRLAGPSAPWRFELGEGTETAVKEVRKHAASSLEESRERLIGKLADVVDYPDRVGSTIANEIIDVMSRANYQLGLRAARLQRDLEERTGLSLAGTSIGHLAAPPTADIRVRRKRDQFENRKEKRIALVSEGAGVASGRAIGAAFSAVFPPAIFIGEAVGGGIGYLASMAIIEYLSYRDRAAQRADKEARLNDLKPEVVAHYREIREHINAEIDRRAGQYRDQIGRELESLIRQEQASSAKSLTQVSAQGTQDAASAVALRGQLAGELAILDGFLGQIADLERAVNDLASGAAA